MDTAQRIKRGEPSAPGEEPSGRGGTVPESKKKRRAERTAGTLLDGSEKRGAGRRRGAGKTAALGQPAADAFRPPGARLFIAMGTRLWYTQIEKFSVKGEQKNDKRQNGRAQCRPRKL